MKDKLISLLRSLVKGGRVVAKIAISAHVAPALEARYGVPGAVSIPLVTGALVTIYDQAKRLSFLSWLP